MGKIVFIRNLDISISIFLVLRVKKSIFCMNDRHTLLSNFSLLSALKPHLPEEKINLRHNLILAKLNV